VTGRLCVTAATTSRSGLRTLHSPFAGLGRAGFVIVAVVALIDAMRQSIKFIVTEPIAQWSLPFVLTCLASAAIGCAILLAVVYARNRAPSRGARQYAMVFGAAVIAAAVVVFAVTGLEAWLEDPTFTPDLEHLFVVIIPDWARYALLGALVAGAWLYVSAEAEQSAEAERIALESARMAQQVAEARLRMLEAQIEPHFLFNTLAHVQRLYETDRANGARMLHSLKEYLGIALPQMRETESTLRREIAHVTAYMNIQGIRMGRRLAYGVAVPEPLQDAPVPPLMLLTLVENAVKHGLAPSRVGGRIDVSAWIADGQLRIQVADTGQGFATSAGGGTGLANIRARLRARFAGAASLQLSLNVPRGVVATLSVPHQGWSAPAAAA
jgi:LytS/YehU family sensor histidine kinase